MLDEGEVNFYATHRNKNRASNEAKLTQKYGNCLEAFANMAAPTIAFSNASNGAHVSLSGRRHFADVYFETPSPNWIVTTHAILWRLNNNKCRRNYVKHRRINYSKGAKQPTGNLRLGAQFMLACLHFTPQFLFPSAFGWSENKHRLDEKL